MSKNIQHIDGNIPYDEIAHHLDLKENDTLLIAADLKNLALTCKKMGTAFNVNTFIDSFQKVLSKGTLLIPAFTDTIKNGDTFDYSKSKPTTGSLSNKVMRRKDFTRTEEPIHSFLVWGQHADEMLKLKPTATFGEDGMFHLLHQLKAKMLMIDVNLQNSFTFIHYIERQCHVNYRKPYHLNIKYIDREQKESVRKIEFHTKKPGIITDLSQLQNEWELSTVLPIKKWTGVSLRTIDFCESFEAGQQYLAVGKKMHRFSLKKWVKDWGKVLLGYERPVT